MRPSGVAEPVAAVIPAAELLDVVAEQPATAEVRVPAPRSAPQEDRDVPTPLFGPFYGGPYVPMPVVDRHRTRVRS